MGNENKEYEIGQAKHSQQRPRGPMGRGMGGGEKAKDLVGTWKKLLGYAVEKNLVASDAGASGQLRSAGHVGVADNIHRQPSPGQQGIAALVSETVLNQSDTVREVDLFSSFQILDLSLIHILCHI